MTSETMQICVIILHKIQSYFSSDRDIFKVGHIGKKNLCPYPLSCPLYPLYKGVGGPGLGHDETYFLYSHFGQLLGPHFIFFSLVCTFFVVDEYNFLHQSLKQYTFFVITTSIFFCFISVYYMIVGFLLLKLLLRAN